MWNAVQLRLQNPLTLNFMFLNLIPNKAERRLLLMGLNVVLRRVCFVLFVSGLART
jgi:hypothetical protein